MEKNHNESPQNGPFAGGNDWTANLFRNPLWKFFVVFFLALILLIPMSWVTDLIEERKERNEDVTQEIASKWGKRQVISGPIVAVPYEYVVLKSSKSGDDEEVVRHTQRDWIFALPKHIDIQARVDPQTLSRGIFDVIVYHADVTLKGSFADLDYSNWQTDEGKLRWSESKLVLGVGDLKGMLENPIVKWDSASVPISNTDNSLSLFDNMLVTDIPSVGFSDGSAHDFSVDLSFRGSESIDFLPLANKTTIDIGGDWSDPSFDGGFLPLRREVSDTAFSAQWEIPHFSRKLPGVWQASGSERIGTSDEGDVVQVKFLAKVNEYQKISRTAKYGALIILLTFAALALVEVIKNRRVHLVQYMLIGVSMVVFYILLLSFTEHLSFNMAYLIAAIATISLITTFVYLLTGIRSVLYLFGGILTLFYGFIFFVLQTQDYALLVGSIGIFLILTALMYYSSKINWYSLTETRTSS